MRAISKTLHPNPIHSAHASSRDLLCNPAEAAIVPDCQPQLSHESQQSKGGILRPREAIRIRCRVYTTRGWRRSLAPAALQQSTAFDWQMQNAGDNPAAQGESMEREARGALVASLSIGSLVVDRENGRVTYGARPLPQTISGGLYR